jgi:hypothetical protein
MKGEDMGVRRVEHEASKYLGGNGRTALAVWKRTITEDRI